MPNLIDWLKKWFVTSTPRQRLSAALLVFSLVATGALFALGGSSGTSGDPLGSTPAYFFGVFVKLVGVLLLIVACAVIFRRWSIISPTGGRVRHLHLIETVRLSPKQSLHLVSVGDQQLLIGATDQTIALIAPVESSLEIKPAEASRPQSTLNFASVLQTFNLQSGASSNEEKE